MDESPTLLGTGESDRARHLLGGAGVVFLLAVVIRQPLLALLAMAVALAVGVALLWRRYGLSNVRYRRSFSRSRAFPGDEVLLELTVENAKLLPLPWLEVQDQFPLTLDFPDLVLDPSPLPQVGDFHTFFAAGPYERIRRRYRINCQRRGFYRFGPASLRTGDVFGFATCQADVDTIDYLVIYPRVLPVHAFGLPAKDPFGDEKPVKPLLEDPLRFSGVRPYEPGDLPRRIHWRASARTGELQSKQFEHSATPTLAIFLDTNTFEHYWEGIDPEALELAISAAGSLAAHGLEERRQVGLYVNTPQVFGEQVVRIAPSRHPAQLARILEALALLIPYVGFRVEALIAKEAGRLPWGATIVVVTGYVTDALEETLAGLYRAGHAIVLIVFGSRAPDLPSRPGFTVYHSRATGEEVPLDQMAEFRLA